MNASLDLSLRKRDDDVIVEDILALEVAGKLPSTRKEENGILSFEVQKGKCHCVLFINVTPNKLHGWRVVLKFLDAEKESFHVWGEVGEEAERFIAKLL